MGRVSFLVLVLATPLALAGAGASAQSFEAELEEKSQPPIPDAKDLAKDIISEEPDTMAKAALAYNATLLDKILAKSTEETIRTQKFAAAAGITGGMILIGLSAWRLIEADPQSSYTRGLGVMFMTLGMADLTTQSCVAKIDLGAMNSANEFQRDGHFVATGDAEQLGQVDVDRSFEVNLHLITFKLIILLSIFFPNCWTSPTLEWSRYH